MFEHLVIIGRMKTLPKDVDSPMSQMAEEEKTSGCQTEGGGGGRLLQFEERRPVGGSD